MHSAAVPALASYNKVKQYLNLIMTRAVCVSGLKSRLNCSIFEVKKMMPPSPKMHFRVYRYRNCGKAIINHYQTCLIY